jgi:MATE family multidrug resistance protein
MIALALPLVISTASWTVMNFIDRMFLLWYSTPAMGAAMPAGMLHFTVACLPLGIAGYVNTFVAQYHGAGQEERIGLAVGQGIRVGLLALPLFLVTIPLAPLLFRAAGHSPQDVDLESTFYGCVAIGGGANVMAAAMSALFTGLGKTRVVMIVDSLASLLNVVLDYAWIFGHWGFPEGGIAGAAWATATSQWLRVALFLAIMSRRQYRVPYRLADALRFDRALFSRLLRFGGPNGLQMLVEVAAFMLFLLLIGDLGTPARAATTLAFNVNSIAWVPMLGLSIALSTMVGRQLGRNRPELAGQAFRTAISMALVYTAVWAVLYLAVPDVFLIGHKMLANPAEFEHIRDLTAILLRFVAVYALFDAANLMLSGVLKGAGDTKFLLWTNTLLSPLPVLAGWVGMTYWGMGLLWCWGVLTGWILVLCAVFLVRYLQGKWRAMRVIEMEVEVEEPAEVPVGYDRP